MAQQRRAARTIVAERLTRQGLGAERASTVAAAVAVTTAVQAQDPVAARLGVRVRSSGLTDAGTTAAIAEQRSVVRTWLLRGTVHLVTATDLPWLVRLIGPSVVRRYRTRWRQLGLSDAVLDASLPALTEILSGPPLNRKTILAALADHGVRPDRGSGSADDPYLHTHVLVHASAVGLVCRAHDEGRESFFTLVDQWLPDAPAGPDGEAALAELARRYFAAYSPATAADFAMWSGLAGGPAVELIRDELTPADVGEEPGFRLGDAPPSERAVRLLPAFDNYVLGYRDRSLIVAPEHGGHIYQGGMIRPAVVVDGAVVGSWRLDRPAGHVVVTPFGDLRKRDVAGIERETADLARYLDLELGTTIAPPG